MFSCISSEVNQKKFYVIHMHCAAKWAISKHEKEGIWFSKAEDSPINYHFL